MLLLSACNPDNPPAITDESHGYINLSLSMVSAPSSTRSDDLSHDEVDSEYKIFEDGIDLNDLAILLFASSENSEPENLLLKISDIYDPLNKYISLAGSPGLYRLNITIPRKMLQEALGGLELSPESSDNVYLRLVALANYSSPASSLQPDIDAISATTYTQAVAQLCGWTYEMANIYNSEAAGEDIQNLYSNTKGTCPMYGSLKIRTTQEALCESQPEQPLYMGELTMLRALAKVRVVDNLPKADNNYPRIIGAEFIGTQSAAYHLPENAIDYQNGQQVHTPRIVEPDKSLQLANCITYRLGTIPDGWSMTPPAARKGATRIGYVPEQKIGDVYDDDVIGLPLFRISVAMSRSDSGNEITQTYDVAMTGYKGSTFQFGSNILRNHIYTLSADAIGDDGLKVIVSVKPWLINRQHIELL